MSTTTGAIIGLALITFAVFLPKQPSLRGWQLHLSTCVILMFVAGGLLWNNIRIRAIERDPMPEMFHEIESTGHGWPVVSCWVAHAVKYQFTPDFKRWYSHEVSRVWEYDKTFLNVLASMFTLGACGWMCEVVIRRREARTS
jgi:hypothetical protein